MTSMGDLLGRLVARSRFPAAAGGWDGRNVKIEGPRFSVWLAPDISDEEFAEAAHVFCKIAISGRPQSPRHRRAVAVRTALNLYEGTVSRRAKELERRYRSYLASGWLRERDLETLPDPRSTERVLLHRLARLGAPSCWRQLFDIANCPQD
jgi:hypothetical protein